MSTVSNGYISALLTLQYLVHIQDVAISPFAPAHENYKAAMTKSTGTSSQIDFVRTASTLENGDYKSQMDALEQRNSRQDYVKRRIALWDGPDMPQPNADGTDESIREVELGSISRLPLPLQAAFRFKMFTIFAIQLLYVWAFVGAALFYPQANDFVKKVLESHDEYIAAPIATVLVLLVLLYFVRRKFPLNWFVLLTFSTAQAALFAALGVLFDTNLGFFNCGATFSCIAITIVLSGVRICCKDPDGEGRLLSTIWAGLIAYVVVALAAGGLFIKFGRDLVTPEGFGASLGFQFVLVMWFSIDASSMYRVMSPDEYMHGVIYFYTDIVLLATLCTVAFGTAVVVSALASLSICDNCCDGLDELCCCCDMCESACSEDCGDCSSCGEGNCDCRCRSTDEKKKDVGVTSPRTSAQGNGSLPAFKDLEMQRV